VNANFKQSQCSRSGKDKQGRGNRGVITRFGIGGEEVGISMVNEGGSGALVLGRRQWWQGAYARA
jgi:hypothetical protein